MTSLAVALVIVLSLPGIPRHPDLDSYAAGHSQWMATHQTLQHSNLYNLPGDWEKAGENIGYGPDLETVIAAMWQSPTHAANFTGDWTHMGVGTARDASGILWVTVVFVIRETDTPARLPCHRRNRRLCRNLRPSRRRGCGSLRRRAATT
jgi:hypothetical protein